MRRGLERALGSALSSGPDGEDSSVRFASTGLGLKEEVIIAIETLVAQLAPEVGYSRRIPSSQFNGSARAQQHFAFALPRHSSFVFFFNLTDSDVDTPPRVIPHSHRSFGTLSRNSMRSVPTIAWKRSSRPLQRFAPQLVWTLKTTGMTRTS